MTTQERLRDAAEKVRKDQKARPSFNGEWLDELLDRAADEIDIWMALVATSHKPAE